MRLAADTNVLLDLAAETADVVDACAVIEERLPDAERLVPPSALDELAFLTDHGETAEVRQLARRALRQLRGEPRFRPLLDLPFPPEEVETVAAAVRSTGLLPPSEVQDSLIVAEAAFLECGILLSSDAHLCDIDHEQLTLCLHAHGLAPPVIASPRDIVRKFFRRR